MIRIKEVTVLGERRVRLTFTDGSAGEVDLGPLLRGPVFEVVSSDSSVFAQVTVDPQLGTIVWPNGADLDPDVLRDLACGRTLEEALSEPISSFAE